MVNHRRDEDFDMDASAMLDHDSVPTLLESQLMVLASNGFSPPLSGASLQFFMPFQGTGHRLNAPPIAPRKFKVSGQWTRNMSSSLMDYLTWLDNRRGSPLPPDLRNEWKLTSWILSNTNYGRNIDLHAIANDQVYEGPTFCCKDLNAFGPYDMKHVTGFDINR